MAAARKGASRDAVVWTNDSVARPAEPFAWYRRPEGHLLLFTRVVHDLQKDDGR